MHFIISTKQPTKSKINNANLRTLAGQAFKEGLEKFAQSKEFASIVEMLTIVQKAEIAAEKKRKQILEAAKEKRNPVLIRKRNGDVIVFHLRHLLIHSQQISDIRASLGVISNHQIKQSEQIVEIYN